MSMNEKRVRIEISGHWGYIGGVKGVDGMVSSPWGPLEDRLMVSLILSPSGRAILAFHIYLPALPYGKEAFLEAVKREGEKALGDVLRLETEEAWEAQEAQWEERQRALVGLAAGVRAAIGLEDK